MLDINLQVQLLTISIMATQRISQFT
jgi:hypothetical protein